MIVRSGILNVDGSPGLILSAGPVYSRSVTITLSLGMSRLFAVPMVWVSERSRASRVKLASSFQYEYRYFLHIGSLSDASPSLSSLECGTISSLLLVFCALGALPSGLDSMP